MSKEWQQKLQEKQMEKQRQLKQQQQYQQLVNSIKPKPPIVRNALGAFFVGGFICLIAQVIQEGFLSIGLSQKEASTATVVVMVFLGALLTGLGVYDNIAKFAGAGSIVPITGFANSIVSPALEFKREGFVYGVAAKMFTIAGPVLVYGFIVSILVGLIYYLFVI